MTSLDGLQEHVDIRDHITVPHFPSTEVLRPLVAEIARRIIASGRDHPVPKLRCPTPLRCVSGHTIIALLPSRITTNSLLFGKSVQCGCCDTREM